MITLGSLRFVPAPNIFAECDVMLLAIKETERESRAVSGSALLAQVDAYLNDAFDTRPVKDSTGPRSGGDDGRQPTAMEVVATTVLRLQSVSGYAVAWSGSASAALAVDHEVMAIECANSGAMVLQVKLALRIVNSVISRAAGKWTAGQEAKLTEQILQFAANERSLGGSENFRLMIAAAKRRGIPISRPLHEHELLYLGHGAKRRRAFRHFPPQSDHIGVRFCANKFATARMMRNAGLPAQESFLAFDESQALAAAQRLGFPVVIKPNRTEYGTGVSVNLRSETDVRRAFKIARRHGEVLVERHIAGENYRLLVMHDEVVAVVRFTSAQVVGDGQHSVRQLIDEVNADRTDDLTTKLRKIFVDDEALRILEEQGYDLGSVPPAGERVKLRLHTNLSVGGTLERVTDGVHPDNLALALRATRLMGLKVGGVDFITTDVSRSWMENGGGFVEINPTPGFFMGLPDGVMEDCFLNGVFAEGEDGRIPVVYVVDEDPDELVSSSVAGVLEQAGHCAALATNNGVRMGSTRLSLDAKTLSRRLDIAVAEPLVTAVVVQLSLPEIVQEGLGLDRLSTAVFVPALPGAQARNWQCTAAAHLLIGAAQSVVIGDADPLKATARENGAAADIRCVEVEFDGGSVAPAWRVAIEEALRSSGVLPPAGATAASGGGHVPGVAGPPNPAHVEEQESA